jgi:DNA polymerase-3 subunit epsilon
LLHMYAIVDIETTGGHPETNGITEIAIVLHNGKEIEERFSTLVNPLTPIPKFVAHLTGISNEMVAKAPTFSQVADKIYHLLKRRIFVAHNVNFDHSFIKYHFKAAGYDWNTRKLCTIRLARKAFPGHQRYGLEHICHTLGIVNNSRHRALGDAEATAELFDRIIAKGGDKFINTFLRREGRDQTLPPYLHEDYVNNLPLTPGVYYFHDSKGKVIYVGKAKCLKHRVVSHFTGLDTGEKRQGFLREIHSVTYQECAGEFTASLLESVEIKKLWPAYNKSQKRFDQLYAIYLYEDARGYLRLGIDKKRKNLPAMASFGLMADAHRTLWKLVNRFELHAGLCFLDKTADDTALPPAGEYNSRVTEALQHIAAANETFVVQEKDAVVLVENGKFYGMGRLRDISESMPIESIKQYLTPYPENEVIRSMIRQYAEKNPGRVWNWK